MQIECGTFHTGTASVCSYYIYELDCLFMLWILCTTDLFSPVVLLHSGEVFTFGNNNHGQLGQGHTKPWCVCVCVCVCVCCVCCVCLCVCVYVCMCVCVCIMSVYTCIMHIP